MKIDDETESDDSAAEMRSEDKQMDEKMTPEQLLQDIKDDLDLLFKKLKGGK
jgi:hypothetical protein